MGKTKSRVGLEKDEVFSYYLPLLTVSIPQNKKHDQGTTL
jgi:hypothetical protein